MELRGERMQRKEHIEIAGKAIGKGHPCFIIAEAGSNFRISEDPKINFKQALKLIDIAADAKADAVKFQLYRAQKLYLKNSGNADYIGKEKSIFDIIKEMELPHEWLPRLKEKCDKRKIIFLCSPFDEESADQLEKVDMPAYKIASYCITHEPLLRHIAKKGKPIIMSTGASTEKEIRRAVEIIEQEGNYRYCLMQCTTKYPAPMETINLRTIPSLMKKFGVPVGLSDHSRIPHVAPLGAVALGAKLIEKHYTTDNGLPGPDHGFAILPHELENMVKDIRNLEKALGNETKGILKEEMELYDFARSYIYAKRNIKKGEVYSPANIIVLRKGKREKGLEPSYYKYVLGKKAAKNVSEQEPLTKECIDR